MGISTFEALKTLGSTELITLDDVQLKQLQETIESMAADVIDFCQTRGLRVYLGGGSALGAIRHQGFIPWDDDMDLNIPREDYEIFAEEFPKAYGDKYWFHYPGCMPGYESLMSKVVKKGTVVRQYEDHDNPECGAYVDIFVLENTFDNALLRAIHGAGCIVLSGIVSCRRASRDYAVLKQLFRQDGGALRVTRLKAALGKLVSFASLSRWLVWTDRWNALCKDTNSKYVCFPTGRKRFFKETYERGAFLKVRMVPFGDHIWPVTDDAENYMTRLYGDYLQIPPEDKREKHAFLEFSI